MEKVSMLSFIASVTQAFMYSNRFSGFPFRVATASAYVVLQGFCARDTPFLKTAFMCVGFVNVLWYPKGKIVLRGHAPRRLLAPGVGLCSLELRHLQVKDFATKNPRCAPAAAIFSANTMISFFPTASFQFLHSICRQGCTLVPDQMLQRGRFRDEPRQRL